MPTMLLNEQKTGYHMVIYFLTSNILIVCTFPPEYCEFGSHLTRCKAWLQQERPDLFDRYYSDGTKLYPFRSLSLL